MAILPKSKYLSTIDIQSLLNSQRVYVLRRSERQFDQTFNDLGNLREEAIELKRIPFLSLNLLGGLFKAEHARFNPRGKGTDKWNGQNSISIRNFLDSFARVENFCNIYIEANGINGQRIPYQQTATAELKREIEKFFSHFPQITEQRYNLEGETRLCHDPINLNYWHLELNLLDYQSRPLKYGSRYVENFCRKVMADIICANSFSRIDDIPNIPKSAYQKITQD